MFIKLTSKVTLCVMVLAISGMTLGCFKNPLGTDRPSDATYNPIEELPIQEEKGSADPEFPGEPRTQLLPNPLPLPPWVPMYPVTMYDVWATDDYCLDANVSQSFLAAGTQLSSIEIPTRDNTGTLQVRVYQLDGANDVLLHNVQTTFVSSQSMSTHTVVFNPVVPLELGKTYKIQLKANQPFKVWTSQPESYVFYNAGGLDGSDRDLSMRIKGAKPPFPTRSRPTKHALLVLLENGGIVDGILQALGDDVLDGVEIPFARCGSFRIQLRVGEDIGELIARVYNQISNRPECLNPLNWTIEYVPLREILNDQSDYLIEEVVKGIQLAQNASSRYDKVVVLEDGQFTASRILGELDDLADEYVVDIHVLSHGGTDVIVGHEDIKMNNFFRPLMQQKLAGSLPLNLRSIYQMTCHGGTLKAEWRAVGAQVVNGTNGAVNNAMSTQYFAFMQRWLNGESFKRATEKSFEDLKPFYEALYAFVPNRAQKISNSRLFPVSGDGTVKVTSP